MWRWWANKQQTCFATDNQPALRDVSSQYDWELGRHNNINIDVFSRNCYMLFLSYCKDAICWSYNKFPSLHSLRLSNQNLIISQQCCGLLLLWNGININLIYMVFQGSLFLFLEYQCHLMKKQSSKKDKIILSWMLSKILHALDIDEYFKEHLVANPCHFKIKDFSSYTHPNSYTQTRKRW